MLPAPQAAKLVVSDLSGARTRGFVMATDLHLTYLVTPIDASLFIDWKRCILDPRFSVMAKTALSCL